MALATSVCPSMKFQPNLRSENALELSELCSAEKYEELLSSSRMEAHWGHLAILLLNILFSGAPRVDPPLPSLNGRWTQRQFCLLRETGELHDLAWETTLGVASMHEADCAEKPQSTTIWTNAKSRKYSSIFDPGAPFLKSQFCSWHGQTNSIQILWRLSHSHKGRPLAPRSEALHWHGTWTKMIFSSLRAAVTSSSKGVLVLCLPSRNCDNLPVFPIEHPRRQRRR